MPRQMFDAVTWQNIPDTAQMVAGYVSGPYAWPPQAWAKFGARPHVRIAVQAYHNTGNCLDCETGDAQPFECPDWVIRRRAAGEDPSVYMNTSTWPDVRAAFRARGVAEPHYWVAQWDDVPALMSGAAAKQYRAAGIYDVSVVADYWPGVDNGVSVPWTGGALSPPDPIPMLKPKEIDEVAIALLTRDLASGVDPNGPGAVYLAEGFRAPNGMLVPTVRRRIGDPNDLAQYTGLGFPIETVPGYFLDRAELGPDVHAGVYPAEQ